ncbi:hypothetical protein PR003_g19021 [Phytophthora rubi]|uniref:Uncharacterized protein n=1 Tax=Phytophthora rubi TaxID=129364 RepID=A0A6A3JXZ6_9STRA|nr:hypothetical protein PR002_g18347 [Phytophthora rubi]KAE9315322.1 hypothetical protein PR003_g19021 [Phytophthora rubi]
MGNRFTRKKTRQHDATTAATAASHREVVVSNSAAPVSVSDLQVSRADERQTPNEVELPLTARQAPPTARDGNQESPLAFFRHCYELDEDPFTLYTQALLLKDQREFAAASELLRSLLSNASLVVETRSHLAQCLIAQDPALSWCCEEATQCLEEVLATSSNNADSFHSTVHRESLELLAHVMIADKRFSRALQLLDALQVALDSAAAVPCANAALRQQQTLVSFQRAFCRYARGDAPDVVSAELLGIEPTNDAQQRDDDPLEGIELLLHADAASLRQGLGLLAATST